ncbi:MAG: ATP-dependent zinc metalloprotease FtsH [Rickettsiales bacterium]|jgi:cell division protease FtsH|nr:ATP-dependent zinc metalloprotease FtsH [Rickettsiales bacterium]
MKNGKKNFILWAVIIALLIYGSNHLDKIENKTDKNEISFTDFLKKVDNKEVSKIELKSNEIKGELKNGTKFYTLATYYPEMIKDLRDKDVELKILPLVSGKEKILEVVLNWLPFIVMIFLWFYFMKGSGGGKGNPFSFGKSKAKLVQTKGKITFKDVAGIDEVKEELVELVDFLKNPDKYTKIGAKIPRGCLLIGEPGTGKTLLAKAVAGEADVPFFFISGSDFVEMFVGVGASRVRDMFEEAKQHAPCLIFIDEIDAVGRHRGAGYGGGNDEREQTLNQLLVEMDGFDGNEGIIIIAATNRSDVLDKALLRPGRFDRQVYVSMPDYKGRQEILNVHAKKIQIATDVDLSIVAKATPGFSGADLANLLNESALLAARYNKKKVTMDSVEEAIDKIRMGLSKKNRVIKPEDRKLTAYHEAGHAIVAMNLKNVDPIHKITIIPRGHAGGVTSFLPEDDKMYERKIQMLEDIAVAFGGRAAEEIIWGGDMVTGGASSDIKYATYMAQRMVAVYGFSEKLGPVNYDRKLKDDNKFAPEPASQEILNLIDSEIRSIIEIQKAKATEILKNKQKDLKILAEGLLKYETLDKEQVEKLLKGQPIGLEKEGINYKNTIFSIFNPFLNKEIKEEIKLIDNIDNIKKKIFNGIKSKITSRKRNGKKKK